MKRGGRKIPSAVLTRAEKAAAPQRKPSAPATKPASPREKVIAALKKLHPMD